VNSRYYKERISFNGSNNVYILVYRELCLVRASELCYSLPWGAGAKLPIGGGEPNRAERRAGF